MGLTVAVTGASGFVGGMVARHLRAHAIEVIPCGRRPAGSVAEDLREQYRQWDIEQGPLADPPAVDAVVHCAGRVDDWGTLPGFVRGNVTGTEHVIRTWPGARFVHVSSASIYDPLADHSHIVEADADPLDRAAAEAVTWLNPYGYTKRIAEHVVATSVPNHAILRPHAVYGPGDTQLIPRLLRRYRFGRLVMVGRPDNRISLCHVENFCHAVERAVRSDATGAFNVVDPTTATLDTILRCVLRARGRQPRITYLPTRPVWAFATMAEALHLHGRLPRPVVTRYQLSHVAHDFVMDITRARTLLGYEPPRDVPESLATV